MKHLIEIGSLFFKMGLTAFGGPAAHIAVMEAEVVEKRGWMDKQEFLDLVGATNLIPGPNSTEMTMHCGYVRAGYPGLIVAGAAFILPAALLTAFVAWLYLQFGKFGDADTFLIGFRAAVGIVILEALIKLGKKALISPLTWALGIGTVVGFLFAVNPIYLILAAGLVQLFGSKLIKSNQVFAPLLAVLPALTNKSLFLSFLKIGSILFGSGYVLVAYLEDELVRKLGWLTQEQLLDSIAMGQFTPGPVLTTATFVGFILKGPMGALLATLGIFLPSFVFAGLLAPAVKKWSKLPFVRPLLNGINAAALGLMGGALIQLAYDNYFNWISGVLLVFTAIFRFGPKKLSPLILIPLAGALGFLISYIFVH